MKYAATIDAIAGLGSGKWVLHDAALAKRRQGERVINLTIGEPDIGTPPELIDVACASMRDGRTGYSNGRGEAVLLKALSDRYSQRLGREVATDRFMCLPGTQTALHLVFQTLCEPGCEVIVGDPMYASYEGLIRATGATPVPVTLKPEHGFRIQPEDIAAAVTDRTRLIFLNTPHNPTGAILRAQELDAIGEIAKTHDLWIVSDEVYEDLTHDNRPFTSALQNPAFEDRSLLTASISKSHAAPGFRSGWVLAPAEFCNKALALSETMLFGSQPFIADMTAQALQSPPDLAHAMAARMAKRAQIIARALDGVAGLHVHVPEAGMFALLDIRAQSNNSESFALDLLERCKVATMPGTSFGDGLEGWLRLALTATDSETEEACGLIRRYCEGL